MNNNDPKPKHEIIVPPYVVFMAGMIIGAAISIVVSLITRAMQ